MGLSDGSPFTGRDGALPSGELQAAILPWRKRSDGGVEILLITSRGGNRWIIPKGWPMASKSLRDSASEEAFEEAGIRGEAEAEVKGKFVTVKTDWLGRTRPLQVVVYAMQVIEELEDWPEKGQRERRWCSAEEAAELVDAPSLRELILRFAAGG